MDDPSYSGYQVVALPKKTITVALVKSNAKVEAEPVRRLFSRPLATLKHAQTFIVICLLDEWICVHVPGFGCGFIKGQSVVSITEHSSVPYPKRPNLTSFKLKTVDIKAAMALLRVVGGRLERLDLGCVGFTNAHLSELLQSCPELTHLTIRSGKLNDFSALVDASVAGTCKITSLHLLTRQVATSSLEKLSSTLSDPSHSDSPDDTNNWQPHRPDTTLPILENTLDLLRNSINGDIHHRSTLVGQQFNAEPVLVRALGIPDNFILFTPQAFEDVLKIQFDNFPKGTYMCDNLHDLLGGGIFSVDGDQWVHQRKTASNLFTMRALRDSMTVTIQRHTAVLNNILGRASDTGEILDLFNLLNRFTIEAFAEIGFGVHMGCLDAVEEHPFQKAFDRAQRALLLRFIRPSWFWKTQKWLKVGVEGQLQRDIEVINTTVLEIVEKALAQRSGVIDKTNKGQGRDIVSLFLDNVASSSDTSEQKVDPMYLRDIVVNFLIAGRDTTAQALSWFFFNLSQNPH
ncbi:hypothetical protein JM18_001524, partial [Phytophthora kernoviae]